MNLCSNCQSEVQADQKFCTNCGLVLVEPTSTGEIPESAANSRQTRPLVEIEHPPTLDDRTPDYMRNGDHQVAIIEPESTLVLELLPDGAVIGEEYMVTCVTSEQIHLNQYCADKINNAGDILSSHVLQESDDWRMFGVALDLAGLDLGEQGLLLPDCAFQQTFGGLTRYYLILSEGASLAKQQTPVDVLSILTWGSMLAAGLATLHQRQIAYGVLTKEQIVLEDNQAYLADFAGCIKPGRPQQYYEDVRQLSVLLYELLTGSSQYDPVLVLPVRLRELFASVMALSQPVSAAEFSGALSQEAERIVDNDSLDFRTGRKTDVGAVRELNEDSLMTVELFKNSQSIGKPIGIYVVADGMGGHEGGEIASGLTIEVIIEKTAEVLTDVALGRDALLDPGEWLSNAVLAANTAVHDQSKKAHSEMGTTVVVALMLGEMAHIAHVGDSRAYRITATSIERITIDHSLVESMVASGQITAEEARTHPQSNVIYRTIGDKSSVDVDLTQARIAPGEFLLLCSDGLNGMVEDETIQRIVTGSPSPQGACEQLIAAAIAAGGDDNITVVIVKPELLIY